MPPLPTSAASGGAPLHPTEPLGSLLRALTRQVAIMVDGINVGATISVSLLKLDDLRPANPSSWRPEERE